jgi:hypothetical protein
MKNIYLQYTKIALVAAIAMSTSGVLAWNITLDNKASGEIAATVEQAGLCQNETVIIAAGTSRTVTTGVGGSCCIYQVKVRGTSGRIKDKTASATPPGTGFDISCRDSRMVITHLTRA